MQQFFGCHEQAQGLEYAFSATIRNRNKYRSKSQREGGEEKRKGFFEIQRERESRILKNKNRNGEPKRDGLKDRRYTKKNNRQKKRRCIINY